MRFSASRLRTWMNCPLAAHYHYDEGLPSRPNSKTVFGSVIHAVLELYNLTGDYDGAVAKFKQDWLNPPQQIDRWARSTSYVSLRAKGLEILESVKDHYRFQDRRVIGAEIPFLVPFGDHELTGFVDLVETQRSGTGTEILKVVDYKSSSRTPTAADLALDVQFSVYMKAVSAREFWVGNGPGFPGVENGEWLWDTVGRHLAPRGIWFNLWNGKEHDVGPRTDVDFGRLYRLCCEIDKATAAQIWVPKIGTACGICDYVDPCSFEIPIALRALENSDDPNRWI
jgi:hypothetical protein